MLKSYLVVFASILVTPLLFLGQSINVSIPWTDASLVVVNEKQMLIPTIQGQISPNGLPTYHFIEKVKSIAFIPKLTNVSSIAASLDEIAYLETMGFDLPTTFDPSMKVTNAGQTPYLSVYIHPFYKKGNDILKITDLTVELLPRPLSPNEKDFALNSVLTSGSGAWYKISVAADGIYKIDKNFLNAMGIQTNGLNPNHIHIFGNGEGCLPELNSTPYTDDLAQNAIEIVGEQTIILMTMIIFCFMHLVRIHGTQVVRQVLNNVEIPIQTSPFIF